MKTETLVEIISDGLDAACDGRGFGADHLAAVNLANAAPELLEACKLSLRNVENIIYMEPAKMENSMELVSLRKWRDILKSAIAKAERSAQ